MHRIDAELGTRQTLAPVPSDLAVDGIDELLKVFVAYSVGAWGSYFTDVLGNSPGRTCVVRTEAAAWRVRTGPGSFEVEDGDGAGDDAPDVTISGQPIDVLRWVWNREATGTPGDGRGRGGRRAAALHRHGDTVSERSRGIDWERTRPRSETFA